MQFLKPITNENISVILDGSAPYIHWFDAPGSVGLFHYKRLIIYAPDSTVRCTLPEESPFYIYVPKISWDGTQPALDINAAGDVLRKTFVQYSEVYAPFFIIVRLDEPGEYLEEMTVNINGTDEVINIGIEIYGENELLKSNLTNNGIEIPESIQSAIYDTDVYEENIDWVLMNNKWRELLNNYMDTLGCKGNYKSLINSLKWFGYGGLVSLNECWKHETQDGVKLTERPITTFMEDWCTEQLSTSAKTTYMTLKHLSSIGCLSDYETGSPRFQPPHSTYPNEPNYYELIPYEYDYETLIGDYAVKWSKQEMAMKMYLLGRFFETYFMPVHLDLLVSSVENIIYDVPYTVVSAGYSEYEDDWTNIGDEGDIEISIINPNKLDGFDNVSKIEQVDVYGVSTGEFAADDHLINDVILGHDIPLDGLNNPDIVEHAPEAPFLGVTTAADGRLGTAAYNAIWLVTQTRYVGLGSLVNFHFKSNVPLDENYSNINKITATTNINHPENDDVWERTRVNIEDNDPFNLQTKSTSSGMDFTILIQKPGEYFITFDVEYIKNTGTLHYLKTFYLKVLDNTTTVLKYYKLEYNKPDIPDATHVNFIDTLYNPPEDPKHAFDAIIGKTDFEKPLFGHLNIARETSSMAPRTPRLTKCKLVTLHNGSLQLYDSSPIPQYIWSNPESAWFVLPANDGRQALCIPVYSFSAPMNISGWDTVLDTGESVLATSSQPVYCFIEGWHQGVEIPKGQRVELSKDTPVYIKQLTMLGDKLVEMSDAEYNWTITSLRTGDDMCVPKSNSSPYIVSCTNKPTPAGTFLINMSWNWGQQHTISEVAPFIYV